MASSPLAAAAIIPTTKGPVEPGGRSPRSTSVTPFQSEAPKTIGMRSKKEMRAAESRSRPRKRAAVIVMPERDTPGMRARLCARPTATAVPAPRADISRRGGVRSAIHRTTPKTARKTAICHGSPRWSAMRSSPSAPIAAAGTVAIATNHAIRSSAVSTRRRRTLPIQAATRRTTSRQKYATTATRVPTCSATSKVWLNSSCVSRYSHSKSHGTRIRWPDEEMGRSSVAPWTRPSTSACQFGSAPARSPAAAIVLVVFSLVVSLVIPRRDAGFPGRNLKVFTLVAALLVVAMLASVEVFGAEHEDEEGEEAAPAETGGGEDGGAGGGGGQGGGAAGDAAAGEEVFASAGCGSCHTLQE